MQVQNLCRIHFSKNSKQQWQFIFFKLKKYDKYVNLSDL